MDHRSIEENERRFRKGVGKLFLLGSIVGLFINIFYFETGIGLALILLPFMGAFTGIVIGTLLEMVQGIIHWLNK